MLFVCVWVTASKLSYLVVWCRRSRDKQPRNALAPGEGRRFLAERGIAYRVHLLAVFLLAEAEVCFVCTHTHASGYIYERSISVCCESGGREGRLEFFGDHATKRTNCASSMLLRVFLILASRLLFRSGRGLRTGECSLACHAMPCVHA